MVGDRVWNVSDIRILKSKKNTRTFDGHLWNENIEMDIFLESFCSRSVSYEGISSLSSVQHSFRHEQEPVKLQKLSEVFKKDMQMQHNIFICPDNSSK